MKSPRRRGKPRRGKPRAKRHRATVVAKPSKTVESSRATAKAQSRTTATARRGTIGVKAAKQPSSKTGHRALSAGIWRETVTNALPVLPSIIRAVAWLIYVLKGGRL
jgi:hypothetical protein